MESVLSRSKMYGTPGTLKIYVAVHYIREPECIVYTLLKKGQGRIRPQIGPLTFFKIFLLEIIYSDRSQHTKPSYAIFNTSLYYWD